MGCCPEPGGEEPTNTPTPGVPPPTPVLLEVRGRQGIVSISEGSDADGAFYFEENPYVNASVNLNPPNLSQNTSPFSFSGLVPSPGLSRILTVPNNPYFEEGYTLCYGNYSCHSDPLAITPAPSRSFSVSDNLMLANGYASAWWHYTPLPGCVFTGDGVDSTVEKGTVRNVRQGAPSSPPITASLHPAASPFSAPSFAPSCPWWLKLPLSLPKD